MSEAERTGERVAKNTLLRAIGEMLGKLASLLLFAVLAREVGVSDVGAFVFAFAWVQVTMMPIGLGFERYILRAIALDRSKVDELFFNVLYLKALRALPVAALSFAAVGLLGYDAQTRTAVYVLTVGQVLDSMARTLFAVFNAFERGSLIAATVVVQRYLAAGMGLVALALGGGVVSVCVTFTVGTGIGLAWGLVGMRRSIGLPRFSLPAEARTTLRRMSRGYGVQDILGILLARLDAVMLSLLASQAAVGRYGAAYRLLESTFFLTSAVNGAFAAMFAYLGRDTEPTVGAVFARSIKLSLSALVPCAVALGVLAEPLSRAFFGAQLEGAAGPLRLLAPAVVMLGLVTLASSLLLGRREPALLVRIAAAAVGLNIALNLAFIPLWQERGAAAAMLVTGTLFAAVLLAYSIREAGTVRLGAMWGGPLVAGAVMAAVMLALSGNMLAAVPAGVAAYLGVLFAVERALNPGDVEFILSMVRRRATSRHACPDPARTPHCEDDAVPQPRPR
ncbi:MAG: flippase [Actinomycetota bacterium]|nr:flippase [Actinomycetota bacterium]